MGSPTGKLIARMRDANEWDSIVRDVPIFREHDLYQVGTGDKAYKVPVLPGEDPPDGAKLLYSVDKDRLEKIAAAINRNIDRHEKPIKLFAGHSKGPANQLDQPPIVGYGGRARLGQWGPENVQAVLAPLFIEKGCREKVKELPERSPEFYPLSDEITSLALLKTDPKLPMGMLTYSHSAQVAKDGAVLYGRGEPKEQYMEPELEREDRDNKPDDKDKEDDGLADLTPEEAHTAARYAKHYEKHHPVFKYMCGKYASEQASAGPSNSALPGEAPPEKKPDDKPKQPEEAEEEREEMARDTKHVEQYAVMQRQMTLLAQKNAATELKLRKKEVAEKVAAVGQKIVLNEKASAKLAERYMKAADKDWDGITEEVLEMGQPRHSDPTNDPFLPNAETYANDFATADDFDPAYDQSLVNKYFREHPEADPADDTDFNQAMAYATKARKERHTTNGVGAK